MDISKAVGVDVGRRHKRRKGRGTGSGAGKTASRGSKGAAQRTGFGGLLHHEGGQMPLIRRIPKRGITNLNRVEYQVVNVRDLDRVEGDVTPESLKAAGLVRSIKKPVKVLGIGEISKKVAVSAHRFSASAQSKIEAAGGTVTVIETSSPDA